MKDGVMDGRMVRVTNTLSESQICHLQFFTITVVSPLIMCIYCIFHITITGSNYYLKFGQSARDWYAIWLPIFSTNVDVLR